MTKRMLIDATHAEETRVVVTSDNRLEEFDFELATKKQLRGNIYLAKVTRVEPSLQAAFVGYGGNRHGFLAFNDIHPDYYRIPISDRRALIAGGEATEDDPAEEDAKRESDSVETLGGDESEEIERVGDATRRRLWNLSRQYKIQEVIKRRQILLVQVVKEERGTKGAAMTSYLSLAGRYCVLMPNTARSSGGISRKITNIQQRKRLKRIVSELNLPDGMALIVRTAGIERSKADVKRDYDFLRRKWDQIRAQTLESTAPCLIHEEGDIITRCLRDVYSREIEEVLVEGDEAYKSAKEFMRTMLPSHAKRVKKYSDGGAPVFHAFGIESQLDNIHGPIVTLKSGGSIVINPTEALVSIDVNSGRATRERHIEETALNTNLEAAEEIARQLRLRDLAGLIVIDFIDMEATRNNASVERRLKECMRSDRARLQVGRISPFGLLEMSRQRLRPSITEILSNPCPACGGSGRVGSTEATSLRVLRAIEEEGVGGWTGGIHVGVPAPVALYILSHKRAALTTIEQRYGVAVEFDSDGAVLPAEFELERFATGEAEAPKAEAVRPTRAAEAADDSRTKRRRRRRVRRHDGEVTSDVPAPTQTASIAAETEQPVVEAVVASEAKGDTVRSEAEPGERRRRGRRGGRRRRGRTAGETVITVAADAPTPDAEAPAEATAESANGGKPPEPAASDAVEPAEAAPAEAAPVEAVAEVAAAKPKRRRTRRASTKSKPAAVPAAAGEDSAEPSPVSEAAAEGPIEPAKPARRRRRVRAKPTVGDAPVLATVSPAPAIKFVDQPAVNGTPDKPVAPVLEQDPAGDEHSTDGQPRRRGWWSRLVTDRRV